MNRLFAQLHQHSTWTLPGGLSAEGDDDQRRLEAFLANDPAFREAALEGTRRGAGPTTPVHPTPLPGTTEAALATSSVSPAQGVAHTHLARLPKSPMRMEAAVVQFISRRAEMKMGERSTADQANVVRDLGKVLKEKRLTEDADPWVHEIQTHHINAYVDERKLKPGKRLDDKGNALPVGAGTLKKKLTDLDLFFSIACDEFEACEGNPVAKLRKRKADFGATAAEEKEPYLPFNRAHIQTIFQPHLYLAHNRDPDLFWCPLLAGLQGARLSECVLATTDDIAQDSHGIWYLWVRKTTAKNKNSIRRIPIPQPLIDLGFLDYVDHVRSLGAKHLWPHRNFTSKTARRLPLKIQSDAFGNYLTRLQIVNRRLVFHSFRHTVVTALLDAGTPVHLSMQICGHEAQQAAVQRGLITEEEARSVHMNDYNHADEDRLSASSPLAPMKEALERSVHLGLDFEGLKAAAKIVLEHTRKVGDRFVTGWPPQRVKYTAAQLARLVPVATQSAIESPTINRTALPSAERNSWAYIRL